MNALVMLAVTPTHATVPSSPLGTLPRCDDKRRNIEFVIAAEL